MLAIKRLPALSASKIQAKQNFLLRNSFVERHTNKQYQNNLVNLCRSFSVLHNLTSKSRHPQLRHFNAEYKAACALIKRSNLPSISTFFNNVRAFHSTPRNNNQQKDGKDDKDKKKKNEEMSSLMMKAVFWMFTTCFLIIMSSLIVPGGDSNQNEMIRYVSWNEFVYSMLSKGEVEELIVRPDLEVVTIILHEGAIIKGKRRKTVYLLLKRWEDESDVVSCKSSGRPRKTSAAQDRQIVNSVVCNGFVRIQDISSLHRVSFSTIRRCLCTAGIRHRVPARKPRLTEKNILPSRRNGWISFGVWGWMAASGPGELAEISGRMNSEQYTSILDEILLPGLEVYFPELTPIDFVQNNSGAHNSRFTQAWFNRNRDFVNLLPWPPKSPDHKPIQFRLCGS